MTEVMWKILRALIEARFGNSKYLSLWNLEEILGVKLAGPSTGPSTGLRMHSGCNCGVPDGDPALEKLVALGLIEELPDLGCRYRIVVADGEK